MATSATPPLPSFTTFGDLLHYLRRRARLTQRELSIAVGYSESMISRLEHNERPPDVATLLAVFVPALNIAGEAEIVTRLTVLAQAARGEMPAASKQREASGVMSAPPSLSARVRLPQRLTSFIGRAAEVAAVTRLLAQARLVTLTGPGGCGKTSLAVEIGRSLAEPVRFHDGIYWVELVPLTDPALIAQSILVALGVEGNRERPALETLLSFIGNKSALLVLDNCEHLIDAAAHASETLLRTCPNLRILVTSRERLNIPGEVLFPVSSLAFPDPQTLPALAALPHFAAIQLFVERSQAVAPNFQLTAQNAVAVAQICARLDGIPLALELAAAALLTFSVYEIAKRLETHFLLSTPGYRTADARHQSLNDTVAWSYNLLSLAEQRLLARLAVFVGGWRAEALPAICPDEADPLAILRQLVQKSLVRVEQSEPLAESHTRYHLLRAIREYATERLNEQANGESTRRCHFAYFVQFASEHGAEVLGQQHQLAMAALDADYYNMRAAFFYANGKVDLADARMRLAAALPYYWHLRSYSYVTEGISWLHAAMVDENHLSLPTQAMAYVALLNLNKLSFFHWNVEVSDAHESKRLLALAEPLINSSLIQSTPRIAAQLMLAIGTEYSRQGNTQKAKENSEIALQIFKSLGDQRGVSFSLNLFIWSILTQGNIQNARSMHKANLDFVQQNGTIWSLCEAYTMQVEFARMTGDRNIGIESLKQVVLFAEKEQFLTLLHDSYFMLEYFDDMNAILLAEEFLVRQRQQGDSPMLRLALHQLGRMYLNTQQLEKAQIVLDEVLVLWRRLEFPPGKGIGTHWSLLDRGQVARFQGDLDLALKCFTESIERFAASSFLIGGALPLNFRGHIRLVTKDFNGAWSDFRQCLRLVSNGPWAKHALLVKSLAGIAESAYHLGNKALSAKLFPTTVRLDTKRRETGIHNRFSEVAGHDEIIAAIPTYLQDPVFAAAWQEGETLSLDEAIALALAG